MSILNTRQIKLLSLLMEHDAFKPVKHYAKALNVSSRTIYNDLNAINDMLNGSKEGVKLERVPRKGILLRNKKMFSIREVTNDKSNNDAKSLFNRRINIAKRLLIDNDKLSYQMLADTYLVSKTSIFNDFSLIQDIIKNSETKIISDNFGTRITGKESKIQKAIKDFAYYIIFQIEGKENFQIDFPKELYLFLPHKILNDISLIVQKNPEFRHVALPDDYFYSLKLSLSIFFTRIKKGFHLEKQPSLMFQDIKSINSHYLASELIERNKVSEVTEDDFKYLNRQLIAHGFEPRISEENIDNDFNTLVESLINKMSIILNVNLRNDHQLQSNLSYHLVLMHYRLSLGISVKNPILNTIKKNYPVLFNATWLLLTQYEDDLQILFTEDEVAFIMIHFQGAVDRLANTHKILIVCPTGIGTSELIANRIKKILFPKDNIEVVSLRKLDQMNLSTVDMVISSVMLNEKIDIPITYVSPLITKEDLKRITNNYLDLFDLENEQDDLNYFPALSSICDDHLIFLNQELSSKYEIINSISHELLKLDAVTKEFKQSIFDRENMGATDLPTGIAIPHPSPVVVKQSKFVILTLKKPIYWNKKMVDTILMICVAENDLINAKKYFSEIYRIVESKKTKEYLLKNRDKKQIIKILGGKEND